jgi:segregation and condensation protein B
VPKEFKKGSSNVEETQWKAVIEALVFSSEGPLSLDRLKEIVGEVNKKDLQRWLAELMEDYERGRHGFYLLEVGEGFQFRTRPEYAEYIKKLKKTKPFSLSQPALETLAIIAYKQPIVRMEIEKIRGVDSGGVLHTLLEKKIIKILGKKDIPGRPLVYGTAKKFLELFGLKDLASLPTLKDIESLGNTPAEDLLLFPREGTGDHESPVTPDSEISESEENPTDEPTAETTKDSF